MAEIPPGSPPVQITPVDAPPPKGAGDLPPTNVGAGDRSHGGGQGGTAAGMGMANPLLGSSTEAIMELHSMMQLIEQTGIDLNKTEAVEVKEQKKIQAEKRLEQLEKMQEKQGKADKGGLASKIFGYVAAAAMMIGGALLIATGVGAAAGVAMLAAGIVMTVTMVLQDEELGKAMGLEGSIMNEMVKGMADGLEALGMDREDAELLSSAIIVGLITVAAVTAGFIAGGPFLGLAMAAQTLPMFFTPDNLQKMGVDEDAAPWVSLGINVAFMIVGIGAGVGAAKVPGELAKSAADATAKTAAASAQTAGSASQAGAAGATASQKAAQSGAYISMGVGAAASAGGGAADISTAVYTKEAADHAASAEEMRANMIALMNYFQQIAEKLEEAIERLDNNTQVINQILGETEETDKTFFRPAMG